MKTIRLFAWSAVLVLGIFALFQAGTETGPLIPGSGTTEKTDPATNAGEKASEANGPGGAFSLMNHNGERVTDQTYRGKYMLLYFGYSFCPDVCPLELGKMTRALSLLEAEGVDTAPIQPIFVTIDPARDTPEALGEYAGMFHPRLVALTGTNEEIAAIARAYRIYYAKRDGAEADGYLMDHLSVIFLMEPDGRYRQIFTSRDDPSGIAAALRPLLEGQP